MPAGPRIRSNSEFGLITDNPLTIGATTFNSARLSLMPVVSAAHAVVTLDPRAVNGEPEIVIITAHTAAATVATITRAAYGTVARSHPVGTEWIHAPIDEDFIEILTSITRPSDPYEGQLIFETDTNKLVGYGGVDWAPRDAGGTIGYAQVTTTQAGISTETDLTGLSVAVTVGTGRRIRITGQGLIRTITTGGRAVGFIKEGSTYLGRWGGVQIDTVNEFDTLVGSAVLTPTAGAHTYKLSLLKEAGGNTLSLFAASDFPAFILVEDIGAA